ncbi:MAG TPA: hypothetical protein VLI44_09530, partial [Sporolactobacillaceae bacterium]|nr:hypothetical protein [Sporolactobacillaceae bacterium]
MADVSTNSLPAFELRDLHAASRAFPSAGAALLCFVKEDCPTCGLSMALIEAAHKSFGESVAIWAIGQDAEGNAKL